MEKIDISKIRGQWMSSETLPNGGYVVASGGDDTTESLQTIAAKVNEIIDHINAMEAANAR